MNIRIVIFLCFLFTLSCKSEVRSAPAPESSEKEKIESVVIEEPKEEEKREEVREEILKETETKAEEKVIEVSNDSDIHVEKEIVPKPSEVQVVVESPIEAAQEEETNVVIADKETEKRADSEEVNIKTETKPVELDQEKPVKEHPDHKLFDALLKKFVSSKGSVDYAGLKKVEASLDAYLSELDTYALKPSWTKKEQLAYWINAYNAYTIKLILDHYPVKSITSLYGGKPWDKKWIKLNGKTYSLNQIENDIIRPQFNEPRIHFAVNCAAVSCPPILNAAFTASNLESLLQSQTVKFINDSAFTRVSKDKIEISKIFEWYAIDFGDVKSFVKKYYKSSLPEAEISYYEYDWSLNAQ